MNNKGFTLVELIATIALLAIISVISFVSINAVIKNNKVSNCENLVSNIKNVVKDYVSDNRYSFTNNNDFSINASVLVEGDYLTSPIVDPFTNEEITLSSINIAITLKRDYTVDSITVKNNSNNIIDCNSGKW